MQYHAFYVEGDNERCMERGESPAFATVFKGKKLVVVDVSFRSPGNNKKEALAALERASVRGHGGIEPKHMTYQGRIVG